MIGPSSGNGLAGLLRLLAGLGSFWSRGGGQESAQRVVERDGPARRSCFGGHPSSLAHSKIALLAEEAAQRVSGSLAVSYPPKDWCLVMLQAYLDESGTDSGDFCFIAGFWASEDRWKQFARRWVQLRDQYLGGRIVHMRHEANHIGTTGRMELARCILDHVEGQLWSAIQLNDFNTICDEYRLDRTQDHKYELCFRVLLETVRDRSWEFFEPKDHIAWFFDRRGDTQFRNQLDLAFTEVSQAFPFQSKLFSQINFVCDNDVSQFEPLQAADFIAWHRRRYQTAPTRPDNRVHQLMYDDEADEDYKLIDRSGLKTIHSILYYDRIKQLLGC